MTTLNVNPSRIGSRLAAVRAVPVAPWTVAVAVALAAIVAYLTVVPASMESAVFAVFQPAAGATIIVAVAVRRLPRGTAWLLLGAGLVVSGIGDISWAVLEAAGLDPFPSVADAFYLGGYLLMLPAVWLLFGRGGRRGDAAPHVDAAILAIGAALVSWVFFMEPIVEDASSDLVTTVVAIAYPVIDVAIIGLLARLLFGTAQRTISFGLVIAGWAGVLLSDQVFAAQVLLETYEGGLADVGWAAGFALLAVASLHPSAHQLVRPGNVGFSRLRLGLLGAASLMAPLMAVVQQLVHGHVDLPIIVLGSTALFLLVLIRMSGMLEDLRRTLQQREALEGELTRQALHDPLTGLANRALFTRRLNDCLSSAPTATAVLFIDLDDFKTVNDTLGHGAGDALLREIAMRVRQAVRETDLVARLGGDEFAVLVAPTDAPADAATVAGRILTALRGSFEIAGRTLRVRASIGVAMGRTDAAGDDLMRDADIAMYLAKGQGKDRVEVFEPMMHGEVLRELQLRNDLRPAIESGQITVHYQPIVDVGTGAVLGLEALARWQHPERGLVPPASFIGLAETMGVMPDLGRQVLRTACRQLAEWRGDGLSPDVRMSVNVSPEQLDTLAFADDVRAALTDAELDADALILEVIESRLLDIELALPVLRQLRTMGVHVALDDFGTGYSSLGYLGRLPIDILKIDRSFIAGLGADPTRAPVVAAILQLGADLGLTAVAEGVEEASQLAELRRLGCSQAQGWLFGPALAASELAPMLLAAAAARSGEAA